MKEILGRNIYGALAGLLATVPMTVALELLHKALAPLEPLAPKEITHKYYKAVRADEEVPLTWNKHSLFAHFAFGTFTGAMYSWNAFPRFTARSSNPVIDGPTWHGLEFGMYLWALNYLGLMPATGLIGSPFSYSVRRHLVLISSHLIYGGVLGCLYDYFYFFGPFFVNYDDLQ